MSSQPAGYSGTPLAKKLGITEGTHVHTLGAPPNYGELLAPLPPRVVFEADVSTHTDIVHIFSDRKAALKTGLQQLRAAIKPSGVIWVSWPKKASKVATDITEDTIRELAFPLDLVDVKVCAVSEIWSALKLVIRKERR